MNLISIHTDVIGSNGSTTGQVLKNVGLAAVSILAVGAVVGIGMELGKSAGCALADKIGIGQNDQPQIALLPAPAQGQGNGQNNG